MRSLSLVGICIAATSIATQCYGQALDDAPEARKARRELCQKVLCREPTTVRLLLNDGGIVEVPFEDVTPIVLPKGWVTVLPGEEVHIAFDVDGNKIRNPRAIRQPAESPYTLTFRFSQDPETGASFLVVGSTGDHVIKFDLGMMLPEDDGIRATSSCPVRARANLYEQWPHPVFQFVIARFRVLAPGSAMQCE